jgi:hypothetical protein
LALLAMVGLMRNLGENKLLFLSKSCNYLDHTSLEK